MPANSDAAPQPVQVSFFVNLVVSIPPQPRFERIDRWLAAMGQRDVASELCAPPTAQEVAHAWLQRQLWLVREMLQLARMPIFAMPEILRLDAPATTGAAWNARVSLAWFEAYPLERYHLAFQDAGKLLRVFDEGDYERTKAEHLFARVFEDCANRLGGFFGDGDSTLPVLRAAYGKGIPVVHLSGSVFQLGWGARGLRIDRSTSERDSAIGLKISHSKHHTSQVLRQAGLPVPEQIVVAQVHDALRAAEHIGWPVVVKPSDRNRGEGVSVDVGNAAMLSAAFARALEESRNKKVVIEQQVEGVCHRVFVAGSDILYAVKRLPMAVIGNGRSNVGELVEEELKRQALLPPWMRSKLQPLDELAKESMAKAGFSRTSIPAQGVHVPLRRIETTQWGGIDEDVSDILHPENKRIAIAAARQLGMHVAGVDLISTDVSLPWYENDAAINEINFAPLLGGGAISRAQIPAYLDLQVDRGGTIPVHVFAGGDEAWTAARDEWQRLRDAGVGAFLTNESDTFGPDGAERFMRYRSAHRRTRACVLDRQAEALVICVQNDEFVRTGLPLERVTRVAFCGEFDVPDGVGEAGARVDNLIGMLNNWQE